MARIDHEDLLIWVRIRRIDVPGLEGVGQYVQEIPIPGDLIRLKGEDEFVVVVGRELVEDDGITVLVRRAPPALSTEVAMSPDEARVWALFLRQYLVRMERRTFLDESNLAALATRLERLTGQPMPSTWAPIDPEGLRTTLGLEK